MSRRQMSWAEKGGCRPKPCAVCSAIFKPPTSGHRYCEPCGVNKKRLSHRDAMRTYRNLHREQCRRVKSAWDLKQYGLTQGQYDQMLEHQAGACAICLSVDPGGRGVFRKFSVDHCHKTGRVRALLCHRCNGALGMVQDRTDILISMTKYLGDHDGK